MDLLDQKVPVSRIAKELGKPISTITREIKRNSKVVASKKNDCLNRKKCHERRACERKCDNRLCKFCKSLGHDEDCRSVCSDYLRPYCDTLENSPYVCNGCPKLSSCPREKKLYNYRSADDKYHAKQRDRSTGFNITEEEFKKLNKMISPLIQNGHSPYAAIQEVRAQGITTSVATLYTIIDSGILNARNMDLSEKLSRHRPKKKRKSKDAYAVLTKEKIGHMYSDYLEYISKYDVFTVEMDCVEGKRSDNNAILTLHWKECHMQLYFMLDRHDPAHVVEMLDRIETQFDSLDLFRECFPLILTDNGEEFTEIKGMERSCLVPRKKRTHVFFCEPNRSDQKGFAERNHRLLRMIIHKRKSIKDLIQSDMTLASNHINSYLRKSLGNECPYDIAARTLPEDFFGHLGLEKLPPEQIILKPSLLGLEEKPLATVK